MLAAECPGGIDIAYEGVGGELQRVAFRSLAEGGRLLQVGYISEYPHNPHSGSGSSGQQPDAAPGPSSSSSSSSAEAPLPPSPELFWGGLTVQRGSRTVYGSVWPKDRAEMLRCKAEVFDLVQRGEMQAWVDDGRSFSGLEGVADAVDYMLSAAAVGKVVVKLSA